MLRGAGPSFMNFCCDRACNEKNWNNARQLLEVRRGLYALSASLSSDNRQRHMSSTGLCGSMDETCIGFMQFISVLCVLCVCVFAVHCTRIEFLDYPLLHRSAVKVSSSSSSNKKDIPAAQNVPQAPPLTSSDGDSGNGGQEEPKNEDSERTWRDTLDDAITIGAAIIISLGIRTCAQPVVSCCSFFCCLHV
jgi:hypothetical protein